MRQLPAVTQQRIYTRVVAIVEAKRPELGFVLDPLNVRTITGSDEAYFAALSVNLVFGHIDASLERTTAARAQG